MSDTLTQAQKTAFLKLPGAKEIQKQYAKEAKMEGSGRRGMKGMGARMSGKGFWDDVGAWFNQAGKDINQFLKDSKIVSNIAAYALPILGAMGGALLTANPLAATAGGIAGKSAADFIRSQGYGSITPMGTKSPMVGNGYSFVPSKVGTSKTKLQGSGMVFNQVGELVEQPKQSGGRIKGPMIINQKPPMRIKGNGTTAFNSIYSEFSKVKF